MICRNCGTEIADKAIVCYRCGTATTDPLRQAVKVRPRRGGTLTLVMMAALVLLALFLGQARQFQQMAHGTTYQFAAIALVAIAAIVVGVRALRRR
jgi:uncharacterized membrane protein YvbJ